MAPDRQRPIHVTVRYGCSAVRTGRGEGAPVAGVRPHRVRGRSTADESGPHRARPRRGRTGRAGGDATRAPVRPRRGRPPARSRACGGAAQAATARPRRRGRRGAPPRRRPVAVGAPLPRRRRAGARAPDRLAGRRPSSSTGSVATRTSPTTSPAGGRSSASTVSAATATRAPHSSTGVARWQRLLVGVHVGPVRVARGHEAPVPHGAGGRGAPPPSRVGRALRAVPAVLVSELPGYSREVRSRRDDATAVTRGSARSVSREWDSGMRQLG